MTERGSDGWRVVWEPAIVHNQLNAGDRLELRRVPAERAAILDAAGKPIVTPRPVVTIALDPAAHHRPGRADSSRWPPSLKKVGVTVDTKDLKSRVGKAQDGARVDVVTLRREDYLKIRDEVRPLDGTVFPEDNRDLAPTRAFARALLGTVDPATREDLDANPDAVAQGDLVGHGGLQQRYDTKLRGTVGQSVVIASKAPDDTVEAAQIFSVEPVAGTPVKTTLDVRDAERGRRGGGRREAAQRPGRRQDQRLVGARGLQRPGRRHREHRADRPGPARLHLQDGLRARPAAEEGGHRETRSSTARRPRRWTAASFKNADDEVLGKVPFHTDFAESCNTAFVNLSQQARRRRPAGRRRRARPGRAVGPGRRRVLRQAVARPTTRPSWPRRASARARPWSARWPWPAPPRRSPAASSSSPNWCSTRRRPSRPRTGPALDKAAVEPLRAMMREVVTNGTGTGLRRTPGKPVFGKTGTAEFENGNEQTHAWFVGWQGDIAFAVMVQKGGAGAEAAVPIVSRFLAALNR